MPFLAYDEISCPFLFQVFQKNERTQESLMMVAVASLGGKLSFNVLSHSIEGMVRGILRLSCDRAASC